MTRNTKFKKRFCRTPRDFELAAADWLRAWGYTNVSCTPVGPDGGSDVIADKAAAQVKAWMTPIGRPEIQQLRGFAHRRRDALFFSLNDYTAAAYAFANEARVALFRFKGYDGTVEPVNDAASALVLRAERQEGTKGQLTIAEKAENAKSDEMRFVERLRKLREKGGGNYESLDDLPRPRSKFMRPLSAWLPDPTGRHYERLITGGTWSIRCRDEHGSQCDDLPEASWTATPEPAEIRVSTDIANDG